MICKQVPMLYDFNRLETSRSRGSEGMYWMPVPKWPTTMSHPHVKFCEIRPASAQGFLFLASFPCSNRA